MMLLRSAAWAALARWRTQTSESRATWRELLDSSTTADHFASTGLIGGQPD